MKKKILFFLLITLLLVTAVNLYARAGGGQSYGGSGGSGGLSGGGSGGGDGGALVMMLIYLVIRYPCIGIPLVIIIIIFLIIANIKGKGKLTDRKLRKSNFAQNKYYLNQALLKLKVKDPNFEEVKFIERIKKAFFNIQTAWSKQNLGKVKNFMSDGVVERFSLQIKMQKKEGWRNIMENVNIKSAEIISIESDNNYDTIHLAITAKAKDYRVYLKTGKKLPDSLVTSSFTEVWSFLRKTGTKSLKNNGLIEGNCPNCAAPLDITDAGECKACKSFVRSPEYDWILSEITQEEEWESIDSNVLIPGVKNISIRDLDFSPQHIEDRVSVMFYRFQLSLFTGSSDPLKKMTEEDFLPVVERRIQKIGDKIRFYRFPAIGKVETLWVKEDENNDIVFVLVKWSGTLVERDIKDQKIKNLSQQTIYSEIYILKRKKGVKSSKKGFNSAHCPNCSAPESIEGGIKCVYCGTILNDGSRDWVLTKIEGFALWLQKNRNDWLRERNAAQTSMSFKPESLIEALAGMMASDGVIDEKEMKILKEFSGNYNISTVKLNDIINRAKNGLTVWDIPTDPKLGLSFLYALIDMALSDGRISKQEKVILYNISTRIGITQRELEEKIKERLKQIVQFGKDYNKAKKNNTPPPPPPLNNS